ncbi:MAG: DUF1932 domain-containing protein [Geminicoccaceae bacterium]
MVRELETLTAECVLAAVAAGIEDEVLQSLMRSHPGTDWPTRAAYNFERSKSHGNRRAVEMEELTKTRLFNVMAGRQVSTGFDCAG